MTDVLILDVRVQICSGRPCVDTGKRWPFASQGDRSSEKDHPADTLRLDF